MRARQRVGGRWKPTEPVIVAHSVADPVKDIRVIVSVSRVKGERAIALIIRRDNTGGTAVFSSRTDFQFGHFYKFKKNKKRRGFMKKVLICDESIKTLWADGSNVLSFKEKLEIAKRLNELCVDVIELSPSGSVNKSIVSCVAGHTVEQIEYNFALIAGAKRKRLNVVMPVSPIQMEYFVSKKPALVLNLLQTLTQKAVSLCNDVEVSLRDATRAEPEFLYQAIKVALENGAKTVSVEDLAGAMLPEEFAEFIKNIYRNVPELSGADLIVGASDVNDLGTANALSAITAGASGIKVSALKTENLPSVEKLSSAINEILTKKGYDTNLNKTAIRRIVGNVNEIAAGRIGKTAEDQTGEKAENLSKEITQSAFGKIIKKRGYDLSVEDLKKVYAEFIRLSDKKEVNTKELDAIIAANALQVPETYSLVSFLVNSSNVLSATASITLKRDGAEISGLSFGNGPVDAAFLAIESITGRHFELDEFTLGAVTEGKEAMGQAVVKLRYNGVIYSGRVISTDIIGASVRAYVGAINKIVFEESKQ